MKLTGKCNEDFGIWFFERSTPIEEYKNYPNLSETCKNALIVEWFDSVGINIIITEFDGEDFWCEFNGLEYSILKPTRHEAINATIEKANELYNKNT